MWFLNCQSPNWVTYTGQHSRTASLLCPTNRNPQAATPGKCVTLKFRCCFISLPPAAMLVGTNLCSEPSWTQCRNICAEDLNRTKRGSLPFTMYHKHRQIKGENKIKYMHVLFSFQTSRDFVSLKLSQSNTPDFFMS